MCGENTGIFYNLWDLGCNLGWIFSGGGLGHVHKYVVDIGKIEKNIFLLQNNQFYTNGVEIFRKHIF